MMFHKRSWVRHGAACLMAAVLVLGIPQSIGLLTEQVQAEDTAPAVSAENPKVPPPPDKGFIDVYQWKRAYEYSELPTDRDWRGMIVWGPNWTAKNNATYEDDPSVYYIKGSPLTWRYDGYTDSDDERAFIGSQLKGNKTMSTVQDTFYTRGAKQTPLFTYAGVDTGNGSRLKFSIQLDDSAGIDPITGEEPVTGQYIIQNGSDDLGIASHSTLWTLYSGDSGGVWKGFFKIFANIGGQVDPGFQVQGEKLYVSYGGVMGFGGWDYGQIRIYVGTPTRYGTYRNDYTVQTGQSLNADNNMFLTEGKTITIEPGAVLSVDGQFYNNGTIINKGTIVVQPKATIESFDPDLSNKMLPNTIICDGGDIVVLGDGRMKFAQEDGGLTLKNESTLVNAGIVLTDTVTQIQNSTIDNRKNGQIYFGLAAAKGVTAKEVKPIRTSNGAYIGTATKMETRNDPRQGGSSDKGRYFYYYQPTLGFSRYGLTMAGKVLIENAGLFVQSSAARADFREDPLVNIGNGIGGQARYYNTSDHNNFPLRATEIMKELDSKGKVTGNTTDLFKNNSSWDYMLMGPEISFEWKD